ncbi:conserved hypothetical protein [Aspergillus lentulus]|nr:conserved hypothetical protein [Aspergillus lentulus]
MLQSGITEAELKGAVEPPLLLLPRGYQLQCLYGKHRIEAAKDVLYPGDRWWTVYLYNDSISGPQKRRLCAVKDSNFSAGDILRNLEHSRLSRDEREIAFWESKMPRQAMDDLRRLEKRYPRIVLGLRQLITYPGLWADIPFNFLKRLVECASPTVRTYYHWEGDKMSNPPLQEISHYLDIIVDIWSNLFLDEPAHVDVTSVRLLENRMPQMREDANFITLLINGGELFPSVASESRRNTLLSSLLGRKGRILSLHSLVQDTLIFQPCAKSLRRLVQPRCKDLRDALMRSFNGTGNAWTIQVAENAFDSIPDDKSHSTLVTQATAAYVQLWLFSIRFIESLTDVSLPGSKRTDDAYVYRETPSESAHQLAILATKLGFDSPQIRSLCVSSTIKPSARAYLTGRRPQELYVYPPRWEEEAPDKVVNLLKLPKRDGYEIVVPPFSIDSENLRAKKLCGLPRREAHCNDRRFLFALQVYSAEQLPKKYPTSFAVLRDIVFSFFGRAILPSQSHPIWRRVETNPQSPRQNESDIVSSPVACDPHPSGTPDRNEYPERDSDAGNDMALDIPNPTQGSVTQAPMAEGFEDETSIAPLNQLTHISHSRGAEEILNAWEASRNKELTVFYFFKNHQYCKFLLKDPELHEHLGNFIGQLENNHYFATFRGRINSRDIIERINGLPLVLVFTETEHTQSPMADLWEYVRSFDARTGKRKQGNLEDSQSATNTRRRIDDNKASDEESEL